MHWLLAHKIHFNHQAHKNKKPADAGFGNCYGKKKAVKIPIREQKTLIKFL